MYAIRSYYEGYIQSRFGIPFGAKANKIITFGSKNDLNPLPVELTEFSGECKDGNISLTWTTASEINNDYFIVEKSENMKDFSFVSKITGSGNSNTVNSYSTTDYSDLQSTYYRLTQTDFDGKRTIYAPINVNCYDNTAVPELIVYRNNFV